MRAIDIDTTANVHHFTAQIVCRPRVALQEDSGDITLERGPAGELQRTYFRSHGVGRLYQFVMNK